MRRIPDGDENRQPLLSSRIEMGVISNDAIKRSKQLPFIRLVLIWNLCLAITGGTAIYLNEYDRRDSPNWFKCFYLALNSSSATGLSAFDITRLKTGSLVLVALCMQLGASTLTSLVPVILRIAALEVALPKPPPPGDDDDDDDEEEEEEEEGDLVANNDESLASSVPDDDDGGPNITTTTTTTTPPTAEEGEEGKDEDVVVPVQSKKKQKKKQKKNRNLSLCGWFFCFPNPRSTHSSRRRRHRRRTRQKKKKLGGKVVTFDLKRYRLVPQWLVEYKALTYLVRIVVAYHLVVYAFYGVALGWYLAANKESYKESREEVVHERPFAWSAFHVISAFNNVGFTLQNNGVVRFAIEKKQPFVLIILGCLVVHGNVFFPPLLRWTIVFLSARSPKDSNRKVYFRYLLLHGRRLYSNLFSSQANWLLVATQVALLFTQIAVTLVVSGNDPGFKDKGSLTTRFNLAAFLAVNCRHAGIAPVDLKELHGATLVVMLAMMWLAPVPFVVALQSSSRNVRTTLFPGGGPGAGPGGGQAGSGSDLVRSASRASVRTLGQRSLGLGFATTRLGSGYHRGASNATLDDEDVAAAGEATPPGRGRAGARVDARSVRTTSVEREVRRRHSVGRLISSIFHGQQQDDVDSTAAARARASATTRASRASRLDDGVRGNHRDDDDEDPLDDDDGLRGDDLDLDPDPLDDDDDNLSTRGPAAAAHVPDAMVDTRALLLERYPSSSPPWRLRVSTRFDAFKYHLRRGVRDAYSTSGFTRDAALMFLAWFLIAAFENFRIPSTGLFYTWFELVSAFGNVGFSLGSLKNPDLNVSFSHDLSFLSLVVVCAVQLGARTRDLPNRIDASLTYPNLQAEDVLLATTVVNHQGTALDIVDTAFTPSRSRASTLNDDVEGGFSAPDFSSFNDDGHDVVGATTTTTPEAEPPATPPFAPPPVVLGTSSASAPVVPPSSSENEDT